MTQGFIKGFNASTRSRRVLRTSLVLLAAAVTTGTLTSSVGLADWPPPLDATPEDFADGTHGPPDPGYRRTWQYLSYLPEREDGAPPVRSEEKASGMSVDLAWRHTIGDDRVRIAVLDSGIKWDHGELLDRAYLNKGELAQFKPQLAGGEACADDDGFDCNGDGIFSVSDYADDPRLKPEAVPQEKDEEGNITQNARPRGDINRNGQFDAGDIIGNFSDGVDDDGNGYVDDISGWDFLKNDNNAYDDTRYGHGTGEAEDSVGAANGSGGLGVCPECRFMPLRVGDSFIADAQDFGKAVLYAADNGASLIQEALGTIDMSAFAQQALDYAWAHNVIIIASMADENARHHNMPATANHTMPVHAITYVGGDEPENATSYLGFNVCTNFGAQNFLSASGTGCSSEATGRLSGIAGLAYSMALQSGYDGVGKPKLTAGEMMQLYMMTADDILVAESQDLDSNSGHYWSQKGFDQRFGYGRVNANSILEAIKNGQIPPDVDVVTPTWFEVLYADQVDEVEIHGTVSAKRAPAYSYYVEWAPGVEPLDGVGESPYTVIESVENIPGDQVTGADGSALATLDLRTVDPTHIADPDSPRDENKYTITVRVRSIAHYGDDIGDVVGELRRAYAVYEDPDLLPGFPVFLGSSGEGSPKLADLDGDGVRDIIVPTADGKIHAYSMASGKPVMIPGFPAKGAMLDGLNGGGDGNDYSAAPAYSAGSTIDMDNAREAMPIAPAVGDLDGDGDLEIVATTWQGTVHVFDHTGADVPNWPIRLPDVPSCPRDGGKLDVPCMGFDGQVYHLIDRGAFASPVLANMDKDPDLEIIQAAFDGRVYVYNVDGSMVDGWPVHVTTGPTADEYSRILSTPAVGDFNGDGLPEVLVGSNERIGGDGGNAGYFFLIDGRGNKAGASPFMPNWPVAMTSLGLFPLIAEGVGNSPVIADIDGDGQLDAIMHGNGSAPLILPMDPGPQNRTATPPNAYPTRIDEFTGEPTRGLQPTAIFGPDTKAFRDTMFPLFAQPSLGDLDQDGLPDIVTSGGSLSMATSLLAQEPPTSPTQQLLAMWNAKTGTMMPGSPMLLEDYTFFNSQAIVDVTGDGYPEAITGTGGYYIHAYDACGREADGFPKFVNQWVIATTTLGDITGDDGLELIVNSREGWLYAWKTKGRTDGVIEWESFHHDNHNTGNLEFPLEQGGGSAQKPLAIDANGSCVLPDLGLEEQASEGCGCSVPAQSTETPWYLLLAGALPALMWMRRRRHAS